MYHEKYPPICYLVVASSSSSSSSSSISIVVLIKCYNQPSAKCYNYNQVPKPFAKYLKKGLYIIYMTIYAFVFNINKRL